MESRNSDIMIKKDPSRYALSCAVALAGLLLVPGLATADEVPARTLDPADIAGIEIGLPITGGSGCPAGTVSAVLSPDYTTLSILYDAYVAQTTDDQAMVRRSCNVAVPLYVPPGLSVSVFRTDYRGYASIPDDGRGNFRVEYFFAGSRGPTVTRNFSEGYDEEFLLRDETPLDIWSRCGDEIIARINSSAMARRPSYSEQQALVAIDSMDITAEMELYLRWRTCE